MYLDLEEHRALGIAVGDAEMRLRSHLRTLEETTGLRFKAKITITAMVSHDVPGEPRWLEAESFTHEEII